MIRFQLPELLLEKERAAGRRILWREVAEATGISRQALANLNSRDQANVTNTAHVEALCRFFGCEPSDLMKLHPALGEEESYHIDELYPGRRTPRGS